YQPTPQSYGVVKLRTGDSISNKFILSTSGNFTISLFLAEDNPSEVEPAHTTRNFKVSVDGAAEQQAEADTGSCIEWSGTNFCEYLIPVPLQEGAHVLTVQATSGDVLLDKFRIFRS